MEGSSNSDEGFDRENVLLKSEIQPLNTDLPPSCDGDNSSVASMNEGSESPLSSWDSEPEIDIPSLINCDGMPEGSLQSINLEENYLDMEEQNQIVGIENIDDGLLWEMDNRSYDELLKKFLEKEEELRVSNFRLQLSEQEIIKLNVQVENSEAQLDNVREELKLKEEELNKQKELSEEEIYKVKIQIENSENRLDNVSEKLKLKEEELNKLKRLLEEEIFKLKVHIENTENLLDYVSEKLKLKEEELNKLKVRSEAEILKLKIQIENSENRLDNVSEELKLKEEELNKLKELSEEKISKLKIQIENSENRLDNVHEELKLKDMKLNKLKELSEEEISKLKYQLEKSRNQFDNASEELNLKEKELNKLKELSEEEISKLKIQIEKSEDRLDNAHEELKLKEQKLNKLKELSEEEISKLKYQLEKSRNQLDNVQEELKPKAEKLQKQIAANAILRKDGAKRFIETHKLHCQLKLAQDNMDKSELELVSNRKKIQMLADSVIMHESKAANHKQEVQKLKSEMLDLQAKFSNLSNELTSKLELENKLSQERDAKVKQEMHCMNEYIKELEASLKEIVFIFKANKNEGNMLKLRVEELEKEVSTQNGVISDKDEEKREAIRQLCYSLEHYRSGYRELVQKINKVYRGRHGHVVIAS